MESAHAGAVETLVFHFPPTLGGSYQKSAPAAAAAARLTTKICPRGGTSQKKKVVQNIKIIIWVGRVGVGISFAVLDFTT